MASHIRLQRNTAKDIFEVIKKVILKNKNRHGETFYNLLQLIKKENPYKNYCSRDLSKGVYYGEKNNLLQRKFKKYKLINTNILKRYSSPRPVEKTYHNNYLDTIIHYLKTSKNLCGSINDIINYLRIKFRNLGNAEIGRALELGIKKNLIVEKKDGYTTYYHLEWGVKYCGYKTKPCGIVIQGSERIISLLSTLVNKVLINRYIYYRNNTLTELKRKLDTVRSNKDIRDIIHNWINANNKIFSIIEQGFTLNIPVSTKPSEIYKLVNDRKDLYNDLKIRSESEIYILQDKNITNFDFDPCEENIRISRLVNEFYTRFYNNKYNYKKDTHYLLGITPPNIKSRLLTNYGTFIDVGFFSGKMDYNETGIQSAIRELEEESGIRLTEQFVKNNQIDGLQNMFLIRLKDINRISVKENIIHIS
tara:strand:+ start:117 stop:1376 length:1260 start_codon:yes stop_codon:yes gene_type:complete